MISYDTKKVKPKNPEIWDEDRYRQKIYRLMNQNGVSGSYRRVKIQEAMDYFYGKNTNDSYSNLLTLHEGKAGLEGNTPFVSLNFDAITPKVQLLLGELRERGFDVSVNAISADALKRKRIFEVQLRFQMDMQQMYKGAEELTGVPFGSNDNLPKNDEELAEYMEDYRDLLEDLMEEAVREDISRYKYDFLRKNLFLDLLISNEVHVKSEIRNGFPQWRRVNALNYISDFGSEDDYQSDASFGLEAYYMNIPDAIEKYKFSPSDVADMIDRYENEESIWSGSYVDNLKVFHPFETGVGGGWNGTNYSRILVISGEWLDVEKETQKVVYDKYDTLRVYNFEGYNKYAKLKGNEKKDKRNSIESKYKQIVRKATLVGGEYLTDYGKCENMVRDYSNPETTRLNYVSLIHNYNNQEFGTSLVNKMGAIQDMKNYVLTIMQKEITTTMGSLVAVDTSRIDPQVYGVGKKALFKLLSTAKAYGLVAYNGAIDGVPDNSIPFKNVEPKSQALVRDALMLAAYFDEEMEKISGIDKSRSGAVGERTLATVNSQRLMQSQFVTDTYFEGFKGFETRLFEIHIKKVAMTWVEDPSKYENVAARLGIFIPEDFFIDLEDFNCYVKTHPVSKRLLLQDSREAWGAGHMNTEDYFEIVMLADRDINRAIAKMLRLLKKRRKEEMEMRQQEIEAQKQIAQAKLQSQVEGQMMLQGKKNEGSIEKQKMIEDGFNRRNKLGLGAKERDSQSKYALGIDQLRQQREKDNVQGNK